MSIETITTESNLIPMLKDIQDIISYLKTIDRSFTLSLELPTKITFEQILPITKQNQMEEKFDTKTNNFFNSRRKNILG